MLWQSLIDDLKAGLDQLDISPLTVTQWPGRRLVTLDHRRVWCLKQHQRPVQEDVHVMACVFRLPDTFDSLPRSHSVMEEFLWKHSTHLEQMTVLPGAVEPVAVADEAKTLKKPNIAQEERAAHLVIIDLLYILR